jgi:Kef-type K+ transport system membrane component KefB
VILGADSADVATAFIEIGVIALALAVLARLSDRVGLSPIPAYLIAGLMFGRGDSRHPISPRTSWSSPARSAWCSCS